MKINARLWWSLMVLGALAGLRLWSDGAHGTASLVGLAMAAGVVLTRPDRRAETREDDLSIATQTSVFDDSDD